MNSKSKSSLDATTKLLTELKAARNAWHEYYGVPIDEKYVRFLNAIGDVHDALEKSLLPSAAETPNRIHIKYDLVNTLHDVARGYYSPEEGVKLIIHALKIWGVWP